MILHALLLAAIWIVLVGEFTASALLEAGFIGLVGGWLLGHRPSVSLRWARRLPQALNLSVFFLYELVLSNLRVAVVVLRGQDALTPAFVAVPISLEHEGSIALLANLVTLTPGTLSVHLSPDRRTLYVHALDGADPEEVRRSIHQGFERRIQALYS